MTTTSVLSDLGLAIPVIAAPMAGGPTTPALVTAATRAGGLGFLAGGYLDADALAADLDAVEAETATFGVNLFAPNPLPVDPSAYRDYRELLRADADRYGVELPTLPVEDDDYWRDKVDLLLARPAPIVSFTFGLPDRATLAALRKAGSVLAQTVTSAAEARQAAETGVDVLVVQAAAAGGHSGTFTPDQMPAPLPLLALLAEISHVVELPLIAAGGIAEPADVTAALRGHADAVMIGTALLLSPESGASAAYRTGLTDGRRGDPVVIRGFTGRPAGGLRNTFVDRYDAVAPLGYPALHHLTRPLRKASAGAGDPEFVNLWAGTGYRSAINAPAEQVLRRLASDC